MPSWSDVTTAAPDLAERAQARFDATGLALLATLRRDGSPRITGIEPLFALGEVWLGMMHGSRKAADLLRDPRLAMHNATVDKNVAEGDTRISGRAVEVVDEAEVAAFTAAVHDVAGQDPPTPFHLFKVDVTEVSFLRPAGDHLVIEWWRPGEPVHRVERR